MKSVIIAAVSSLIMLFGSPIYASYMDDNPKYYGAHLCAYKNFKCIQVKRGDTWAKMFPNKREREIVKRLNRMNIALRYRSWIVVPTNLKDLNYLDISPFPLKMEATGKKLVVVNLGLQAFAAYDKEGNLVHWGPISGGRDWCDDVNRPCRTATGSHRIIRKQGAGCESSKYPIETNGGAPMPWCMHYYRGFALHGANLPGFHASHGCVRLFHNDAKWLNRHFIKIGTRVIVMR